LGPVKAQHTFNERNNVFAHCPVVDTSSCELTFIDIAAVLGINPQKIVLLLLHAQHDQQSN
jgi:hypothetical protein